jgi:biotin carboxylase
MNFVFISPNFPDIYYKFVKALHQRGFKVLGIGDTPYNQLLPELKSNLDEYYFVGDMRKLPAMIKACKYFEQKYGHIDYIESNNEYWLMQDAELREIFDVNTGFWPNDMDKIKYKSKMKKYFEQAGVKTARYTLVTSLENSLNFISQVGYPVFVKPDCGVGASESYKISNYSELLQFHMTQHNEQFIMEEFIHGIITSFDGICDDNSNALLIFNEHFPVPVADVVNKDLDDYYYASTTMDKDFEEMGRKVVKAFGIKKRCFHIEFWQLLEDKEGLAKKGDILALECNMRSPGGDTPDLLSIALNNSYYDVYGDIIAYNQIKIDLSAQKYLAISVARKDRFNYLHPLNDITTTYKDNLVAHGRYPKGIALAMGDEFYFGRFNDIPSALSFQQYIQEKLAK